MTEYNVSIRLSVRDQQVFERAMKGMGAQGEAALKRIQSASRPASAGLAAIDEVSRSAQAGMNRFASQLGPVGAGLSAMGPAGLAVAAGIGAAVAGLTKAITVYADAEQRMMRLEGVLKATGHAAGVTATELEDFAERLDRTTLTSKAAVLDAASALATFRTISGDAFTQTLSLAQDMAAVFGTDLRSAAVQLGKALEDPTQGITALRRVGVNFTAAQREMIDAMVEAGDVAGAQRTILEGVERQLGGAGQAEAGGLKGATDALSQSWTLLLEEFGKTPGIVRLVEAPILGLKATLDDLRGLAAAPDLDQHLAAAERRADAIRARMAEVQAMSPREVRLEFGSEAGRRKALDGMRADYEAAFAEYGRLQEALLEQVARDNAKQAEADAGAREARAEETLAAIAEAEKRQAAERLRLATDTDEKIAAARRKAADDIAGYERLRAMEGADESRIEALIAQRRDVLAREVEAIERPAAEVRRRQIQAEERRAEAAREASETVVAGLKRELELLDIADEAARDKQRAVDQALSGLKDPALADEAERLAAALWEQRRAQDAATAARAEGKSVTDAMRTAEERYIAEIERLDALLAKQSIDRETRDRAAIRAQEELKHQGSDTYAELIRAVEGWGRRSARVMAEATVSGKMRLADLASFARSVMTEVVEQLYYEQVTKPAAALGGKLLSGIGDKLGGWLIGGGGPTNASVLSSYGNLSYGGLPLVPALHAGGIAGRDASFHRRVPAAAFDGAPRLHGGGLALGPDEMAAILRRGEEVLTEADPRHRRNLGRDPAPPQVVVQLTQHNDFRGVDASSMVRVQAMLEENRRQTVAEVSARIENGNARLARAVGRR